MLDCLLEILILAGHDVTSQWTNVLNCGKAKDTAVWCSILPRGYTTFSVLKSTEHEIATARKN